MKINPVYNYQRFGRAFTTKEKQQYQQLIKDSKQALGIKDTTAIIFDFNVPSERGFNTGIGTTFSKESNKFIDFLSSMIGINSVQMQPQGKITEANFSPYSGTNYALGEHIIDLKKLSSYEYGHILTADDIKETDEKYDGDKNAREYKTDYIYVLGEKGVQNTLLYKAFQNFNTKLSQNDEYAVRLNNEFTDFKQHNSDWLIKDAVFEILSANYGTDDFRQWSEQDKLLYSKSTPKEKREQRINELLEQNKEKADYEIFKQFIADKQQKESKNAINSKGIKLYGDCLIGFSQSEMWGDIDCFQDNLYYGGPDPNCPETNGIQTWGLPALDYTKLGKCGEDGDTSELGETGKLLYDKYRKFFERYDAIRVDAAWQFATPFIYREINGSYQEVKQPEIGLTVFNIMKAAAKNSSQEHNKEISNDEIMLEMVGISAGQCREMTLNKYPHIYTTAYAEFDECPQKFLEKGYKQGNFIVGVGCHDNDSLVNMAKDPQKRKLHETGIKRDFGFDFKNLQFKTKEYNRQSQEAKDQEEYRNVKFAEILTSAKHFFTLPDIFGMKERINISGKTDKSNWTVRIPGNFEKFYYTQLSDGFGLNMPKALANAMQMRKIDSPRLIQKCNEAAEILRSKGPMTEEEANFADNKCMLGHKFSYNV